MEGGPFVVGRFSTWKGDGCGSSGQSDRGSTYSTVLADHAGYTGTLKTAGATILHCNPALESNTRGQLTTVQ